MGALAVVRTTVNKWNVAVVAKRARRRDYRDRTLLVANQWDGSVQQFYHFLLGYFGPLTVWLQRSGERRIAVRDCGPMNGWFAALPGDVDVQVVQPGTALFAIVGKRTRYQVLQGLDDPNRFRAKPLLAVRRSMLQFLDVSTAPNSPRVVVIDRLTSEAFYRGPLSETEMSGSERRSVPNLQEVVRSLVFRDSHDVVDTARMDPRQQVALFLGASTLIAQHGAGLAHMLWMPPGSTVVEIHPPLPAEAVDTFKSLADVLGHRYLRVPQSGVHAPIDPSALESALRGAGVLG